MVNTLDERELLGLSIVDDHTAVPPKLLDGLLLKENRKKSGGPPGL